MGAQNPLQKNVLFFDKPFTYVVNNQQSAIYCAFCLRKPEAPKKLQYCSRCRHARYCDRSCQRLAWSDHKHECARLVGCFPNLPITEVIFLGRVLDKLSYIAAHGDKHSWYRYRTFDNLMSHEEDIREQKVKDPGKYRFDKVYAKLKKYFGEENAPTEEQLFPVFCRTSINGHSIHNSSSEEIGMALDLGVSKYNHSCRPNSSLMFDGYKAIIRSLVPGLDVEDTKKTFISYIDVGRSRYQRRQELLSKWFFHCECERCMDPEDDRLTSIKCTNPRCAKPVVITEISNPDNVVCSGCNTFLMRDHVMGCQELMKTLPVQYVLQQTEENKKTLKKLLLESREKLSSENIYYGRLLTAYTNVSGGNDPEVADPEMHKMVCSNFRRCFPATDRHVGYQLLHIVAALIKDKRREEAVPYAYEAMTIFEVCFGIEHPYYLQTIALWTYLEQSAEKSDEQLLGLMNFSDNKPVDLTNILKLDNEGTEAAAPQAEPEQVQPE